MSLYVYDKRPNAILRDCHECEHRPVCTAVTGYYFTKCWMFRPKGTLRVQQESILPTACSPAVSVCRPTE
jgi:hypothetical protein